MTGITIRRTGAEEYGNKITALICGEAGSGKTVTASTAPGVLFAAAEPGLMSIADRNVPYVDINDSLTLLQLKVSLDQPAEVRNEIFGFEVKSVVIDTLDEVQRILVKERLEDEKREHMSLQDFGWIKEQMTAMVRGFRNLPNLNIIFVAHLKETSDQVTGKMFNKPALQGSFSDEVAQYVDLALLLKRHTKTEVVDNQAVMKTRRYLQTYEDDYHEWVKDRSGKLPAEFELNGEDDFRRIWDVIFGDVNIRSSERRAAPDPEEILSRQTDAQDQPPSTDEQASVGEPGPAETVGESTTPGTKPDEQSSELPACQDCGGVIESKEREQLSRIRFKRSLCEGCFANAKKEKN